MSCLSGLSFITRYYKLGKSPTPAVCARTEEPALHERLLCTGQYEGRWFIAVVPYHDRSHTKTRLLEVVPDSTIQGHIVELICMDKIPVVLTSTGNMYSCKWGIIPEDSSDVTGISISSYEPFSKHISVPIEYIDCAGCEWIVFTDVSGSKWIYRMFDAPGWRYFHSCAFQLDSGMLYRVILPETLNGSKIFNYNGFLRGITSDGHIFRFAWNPKLDPGCYREPFCIDSDSDGDDDDINKPMEMEIELVFNDKVGALSIDCGLNHYSGRAQSVVIARGPKFPVGLFIMYDPCIDPTSEIVGVFRMPVLEDFPDNESILACYDLVSGFYVCDREMNWSYSDHETSGFVHVPAYKGFLFFGRGRLRPGCDFMLLDKVGGKLLLECLDSSLTPSDVTSGRFCQIEHRAGRSLLVMDNPLEDYLVPQSGTKSANWQ